MQRAIAEGRSAWPEIAVPDEAFADYLRERAAETDLSKLHAGDLYLACGCSRGDARAMARFDEVFLSRVEGLVRGVPGATHMAADIAQTVRIRLLGDETGRRRILDYRGTGPLAGWVRVIALRLASNARRGAPSRTDLDPSPVLLPPSIEDATVRARYGPVFNDAFRRAFQALDSEDRLVIRLHYADGLTLDEVAAALDFSRATAGRRLQAARTRVREETLRILGVQLKATRTEIESVLAILKSHLDVSFGALVTAA